MTLNPSDAAVVRAFDADETGTGRNKRHSKMSVSNTQTNHTLHHAQWAADH
ncbi:MAG: hypothetical protein ACI3YC_09410 [Alloprevotella sp.]